MQKDCPICGSTEHEFVNIGGRSVRVCPEMPENHILTFNPKDFKIELSELSEDETSWKTWEGMGESQNFTKEGV